jgi:outer membrane biosynthesis protein TonB
MAAHKVLALLLVVGCAPKLPPSAQRVSDVEAEVLTDAAQPLPTRCADRWAEDTPASTAKATLDPGDIQDVFRTRRNQLRACHAAALRRDSSVSGTVKTRSIVDAEGGVCATKIEESSAASPDLERCVLGQVARLRFPPPKGGGIAFVSYPLAFEPADADGSAD